MFRVNYPTYDSWEPPSSYRTSWEPTAGFVWRKHLWPWAFQASDVGRCGPSPIAAWWRIATVGKLVALGATPTICPTAHMRGGVGWGGVGVMMITFTRSCTRCCLQWGGVGWGGAMIMLTRPCTRLWCCAQDDLSYFRVGWDECILQQFARILLEDDFTVVLVAHSWVFSDGQCWVDFLSPFLFFLPKRVCKSNNPEIDRNWWCVFFLERTYPVKTTSH